MSGIKIVLKEAIGTDLAAHYYFKSESGQKKKIEFDRGLALVEKAAC